MSVWDKVFLWAYIAFAIVVIPIAGRGFGEYDEDGR